MFKVHFKAIKNKSEKNHAKNMNWLQSKQLLSTETLIPTRANLPTVTLKHLLARTHTESC